MDFFGKEFKNVLSLPFYLAISSGQVERFTCEDKFGENPEVDTSTSPEDITEIGGVYIFSAWLDIDTLSSSDVLDTGILLEIVGQLEDNTEVTYYAEIDGQNKVLMYDNTNLTGDPKSLHRVYRMQNVTGEEVSYPAKNITGDIYLYVDGAITGGIPDVITTVRAKIINWNNQTQMAIYTIPKGKTGYLIKADVGMSKPVANATARIQYKSRRKGGVFKVKKTLSVLNNGTSIFYDYRTVPDIIPTGTDIVLTCENVSANGVWISASFQIVLIDDPRFS